MIHTFAGGLRTILQQRSASRGLLVRLSRPLLTGGQGNMNNPSRPCVTTAAASRWMMTSDKPSTSIDEENDNNDNNDYEENIRTAWIPPQRPLIGDQGQSNLYTDNISKDEDENNEVNDDETTQVDWLRTRRSVLNKGGDTTTTDSSEIMTPSEASARQRTQTYDIPVKHHMLLSEKEIGNCLEFLGGRDATVVYDDPNERRMGGPLGIIIVTADTVSHMRSLAGTLVRQLRRRKLQEKGVVGAESGAEGNNGDDHEGWMVVDCHNFIVHVQDERTRKAVDLEALWSGRDALHRINLFDEDAVDNYVAANPVPEDYGMPTFDWDERFKQLQKNRWTAPHRPVIPKKYPKRNKRKR